MFVVVLFVVVVVLFEHTNLVILSVLFFLLDRADDGDELDLRMHHLLAFGLAVGIVQGPADMI